MSATASPEKPSSTTSSPSAMIFPLNIVRAGFLFVFISVLMMYNVETSTAKSLGMTFQDDFWSPPEGVSKRNSWWSKKSLESSPEYQDLIRDAGSLAEDKLPEDPTPEPESSVGNISYLYDCYTQSCVPDFVSCTQRSRTKTGYRKCKSTHRLCALNCWVKNTEQRVEFAKI